MNTQILRSEYKEMIIEDEELKFSIAKALGRRISSITRWLREDDLRLTTVTALNIIRKHLNLDESVVLTETKESQNTAA